MWPVHMQPPLLVPDVVHPLFNELPPRRFKWTKVDAARINDLLDSANVLELELNEANLRTLRALKPAKQVDACISWELHTFCFPVRLVLVLSFTGSSAFKLSPSGQSGVQGTPDQGLLAESHAGPPQEAVQRGAGAHAPCLQRDRPSAPQGAAVSMVAISALSPWAALRMSART